MTAARTGLMLTAVLLPVVFAFADGGTSDSARAAFLAAACLVAAGAAAVAVRAWPAGHGARAAVGALAALTALTVVSRSWTPDPGGWLVQVELTGAYLALAYAAAVLAASGRPLRHIAEQGAAAGTVLVSGYALLARLLSDVIGATEPQRSGGRLSLPLGYWNAEGGLAALGLVLCTAVAADRSRRPPVRAVAIAATAPLALAVQLSYSRAAIVAVLVGLLIVVARSTSPPARAMALAGAAAAAAIVATLPFAAVRRGPVDAADGWPLLVLLGAICAAVLIAALRVFRREHDGPAATGRPLRLVAAATAAVLAAGLIVTALLAPTDDGRAGFGASGERLTQLGSNRAQYWRVAVDQFGSAPIAGHGAGSFAGAWLRERRIDENVINAHSLWLETGAELGLAGLLLLLTVAAGTFAAARHSPATAAIAATASYAALAGVDWHWQIPALTGVAIVQLGVVLGTGPGPPVTGVVSSSAD